MGLHTLRHTDCSHLAMQNIYTHTAQEDALAAGREFKYA
jgi:hypothetical protein